MTRAEDARNYDASNALTTRWAKRLEKEGIDGLRIRKTSGAKSKFTAKHKKRLVKMLLEEASSHGWLTDLWIIPTWESLLKESLVPDTIPAGCVGCCTISIRMAEPAGSCNG